MLKPLVLLVIIGLLVAGCSTPVSVDKIQAAKKVVIVAAFEPQLVGQRIAMIAVMNDGWTAENTGFDINGAVLAAVKTNLNREVKLVDGKDAGLVVEANTSRFFADLVVPRKTDGRGSPESLSPKLAALGREWGADTIVLLHSGTVSDWVQNTSLPVMGIGHLYAHRDGVYCVLLASVYDCRTGERTVSPAVKQMRRLAGVHWYKNWAEYPPEEQRVVLRSLDLLIKDSVPVLLSQLGLTEKKVPLPSTSPDLLGRTPPPQSFVPEGNELEIPRWASKQQARSAVADAFKRRGWSLTTDTEERMVGVFRKGKREAVCTVTFTDRTILLAPEGFEIQADEKRVPVNYYQSWNSYLKSSILEVLMKVPDAGETPAPRS